MSGNLKQHIAQQLRRFATSWFRRRHIAHPKPDGYRSVHLVYRYQNVRTPDINGLLLELQLRSRLQHAWATAVETMGTFLGQALKSGYGDSRWRAFFEVSSAALAHLENSPPVPGYEEQTRDQTFARVAEARSELRVLDKLRGFSIAAGNIHKAKGKGPYHLVVLNSADRSVTITPYPHSRLEQANTDYTEVEKRTQAGEAIEAMLVPAGPVEALKKAYPNFFLDTQVHCSNRARHASGLESMRRRRYAEIRRRGKRNSEQRVRSIARHPFLGGDACEFETKRPRRRAAFDGVWLRGGGRVTWAAGDIVSSARHPKRPSRHGRC